MATLSPWAHRRGSYISDESLSISPAVDEQYEEYDDDDDEEEDEEGAEDQQQQLQPVQSDCNLTSPHFCKVLNPGYSNWKY